MSTRSRINPAAIASRINSVQNRHKRLNDLVAREQGKPLPDTWVLQTLKRKKLQLKDLLHRYEGLQRTLSRGDATT